MSRINVANFRHPDGTDDNINLDSSGRVGVGETSPTNILHVTDASQSLTGATLKLESSATTGAADTGPVIQFYGHSGSEPRYHSAIKGAKENGTSGNTAGYLAFATRPAGGSMAEQARIASDGEFRFNSGYGSVAAAYGVRAWINFDGTSGTIGDGRADGNMDAVTDHGTGTYSCNFTTDMPDANYIAFGSVIGSSNTDATNGFLNGGTSAATAVHSTSAFRFITLHVSNGATDYNQVQVGVIR